jgi:hypothetical protein
MIITTEGREIKNITLQVLYRIFEEIGFRHNQIQTTTIGDIFEIDLTETTYPLLHVSTATANFAQHTLTYNFQLIVMDLVSKDESNEKDVLSDTLETIGDVISLLKNQTASLANIPNPETEVAISPSVSCEPFTERFDNEVSGWTASISIEVAFNASMCSGDVAYG